MSYRIANRLANRFPRQRLRIQGWLGGWFRARSRAVRIFELELGPANLLFWLMLLVVMAAPLFQPIHDWIDSNAGIVSSWITLVTLVYMLITLGILRENRELSREAQRQRLGAVKPALLFALDHDLSRRSDKGELLFNIIVRNAGVGPALNAYIRWHQHQAGIGEMRHLLQPVSLGPGEQAVVEFSVNRSTFHARMIETSESAKNNPFDTDYWTELGRLHCDYRDVNMYFCESSARIDMVAMYEQGQAFPRVTGMRVLYRDTTV